MSSANKKTATVHQDLLVLMSDSRAVHTPKTHPFSTPAPCQYRLAPHHVEGVYVLDTSSPDVSCVAKTKTAQHHRQGRVKGGRETACRPPHSLTNSPPTAPTLLPTPPGERENYAFLPFPNPHVMVRLWTAGNYLRIGLWSVFVLFGWRFVFGIIMWYALEGR